jgi:hypothetical protein
MAQAPALTMWDNAKLLTVALCREKLMEIDDLIAKNGEKLRYTEMREFFERQLSRCMRKRNYQIGGHE